MKLGNIYVPPLIVGVALLGAVIVALTFAGVFAFLPVWASAALCGAATMAVAFLAHYVLCARRLTRVVWHNLPDFPATNDTFVEDISQIDNPTPDPLHLPSETSLFFMMAAAAFFAVLLTLAWLRWITVVTAILGAFVYVIYDYLPRFGRASRQPRARRKKKNSR